MEQKERREELQKHIVHSLWCVCGAERRAEIQKGASGPSCTLVRKELAWKARQLRSDAKEELPSFARTAEQDFLPVEAAALCGV